MNKNNVVLIGYLYTVFMLVLIIAITYKHIENNKDITEIYNTYITEIIIDETKLTEMRITAYIPTGNKTALGEEMIPGRTAAVSPACSYLLGEKVYIRGYGIRYVNDVTAEWLDDEFDMCTLDLAVPNEKEAMKVGNNIGTVVKLVEEEICSVQKNN